MLFCAVKDNVSPVRGLTIDTLAPVRLPPLSTLVTVSALSSTTAEPPLTSFTDAPAVTVGATCTVSSVLVTAVEFDVPSLATQLMVRLVSLPPLVGSAGPVVLNWT